MWLWKPDKSYLLGRGQPNEGSIDEPVKQSTFDSSENSICRAKHYRVLKETYDVSKTEL